MQKKGIIHKTIKTVNVKQDDRQSRFVVDLKEKLAVEVAREAQMIKKTFIKRLPPLSIKAWYSLHKAKMECLAVFAALMFIAKISLFSWRLFYELCHAVGWLSVFLARFLFLLSIKILKPLISVYSLAHIIFKKIVSLFDRSFIKTDLLSDVFKGRFNEYKKNKTEAVFFKAIIGYQQKKLPVAIEVDSYNQGFYGYAGQSGSSGHPFWRSVRQTGIFCLALLALILPLKAMTFYGGFNLQDLKGRVLGVSEEGARDFLAAAESASSLDFSKAKKDFSDAGDNFLKARSELDQISSLVSALALVVPDKNIQLASEARHILSAVRSASDLGNNLSLAIEALVGEKNKNAGLKERLDGFILSGDRALQDLENMKAELDKINVKNLPEEYQERFIFMLDKAGLLSGSLREFTDLAEKLKNFLGMSEDKRYLLVFQNNSELRATGGFIGSFAIVDFRDGKIKNIEAPGGGSYDTEAGLKTKIAAPEPLWLVNPLWHFWDANWWPDWPTSARKLEWFYEKSDGSTVDGVISFTPTVMEDILRAIGPIDMSEKYGAVITADNFWLTTQRLAEQKPDQTKEPKKIIGDLMLKIIEELPKRLDQKVLVDLLRVAQESLDGRQMLFYFNDEELEKKTDDYGWSGAMKKTSRDYLAVVNTNIAGGKSDRKIEEKIFHQAEIADDGSIVDEVRIERTHTGIKREEFSGVRNVNWMRVYVPLGSSLIEASGFSQPDKEYFSQPDAGWAVDKDVYRSEIMARTDKISGTKIYEENGYTVFANWSMVDPQETTTINLRYKLPFKLEKKNNEAALSDRLKSSLGFNNLDIKAYSLLIQKQAGAKAGLLESSLKVSDKYTAIWHYPDEINMLADGWQVRDELNEDKYWAVLMEKEIINQ